MYEISSIAPEKDTDIETRVSLQLSRNPTVLDSIMMLLTWCPNFDPIERFLVVLTQGAQPSIKVIL